MNADVIDIDRNHRAFVLRESRRAVAALESLAGMPIIDLPAERRSSEWCALLHKPPVPRQMLVVPGALSPDEVQRVRETWQRQYEAKTMAACARMDAAFAAAAKAVER